MLFTLHLDYALRRNVILKVFIVAKVVKSGGNRIVEIEVFFFGFMTAFAVCEVWAFIALVCHALPLTK